MKKGMPLVAAYPFPLSFSRSFSLQLLQQLDQGFGLIIRLAFRRAGAVNQSRRNAQGLRAPQYPPGGYPPPSGSGRRGRPAFVRIEKSRRAAYPTPADRKPPCRPNTGSTPVSPQSLEALDSCWTPRYSEFPGFCTEPAPRRYPQTGNISPAGESAVGRLERPGGPTPLPRRLVDKPPQTAAP